MKNAINDAVSITEKKEQSQLTEPPLYNVVLYNDDYTPMDFVTDVLMKFFFKSFDEATTIMFQVHKNGKGLCGVFTAEIAETKVNLVTNYARKEEHPLLCKMEKV